MAELVPYPLGRLISRMFREFDERQGIFDLPARSFVLGEPGLDLSVRFHGQTAGSPLGPAAGPQSQLAQNIVLAFLGGGRIFELKTVQILDELEIPRPCIDLQTVGYNVEWSQELRLEQSLEEYVKASMLVEILVASQRLSLAPGFERVIYDMSVGYDLRGIQTDRVQAFLRGMLDASEVVERLRREIPDEYKQFRDLDFRTRLSDTLTLSTFHGCPPDEIERIIAWLLDTHRLHCIVKLNPTLLGPEQARDIFNATLGYADRIPDTAFESDTRWEQAVEFVQRLGQRARELELGFGVKFSNTLIVENQRSFFPETEKQMYLSGKPLHVLAMTLVKKFRAQFGDAYPISFSAGIDATNFAESVALGLVPITVCTDLLRPGGYGRMRAYFQSLAKRMRAVGASHLDDFVLLGHGHAATALDGLAGIDAATRTTARAALAASGEKDLRAAVSADTYAAWLRAAKLLNTNSYADTLLEDDRYRAASNLKPPKKVGTTLWLFECLTCDKCVPVCPNDANFTFALPKTEIPVVKLHPEPGGGFRREASEPMRIEKKHQIANFADFCNECGNCDVFCPEDGGPYVLKPRFFGSYEQWQTLSSHDGFFVQRDGDGDTVWGRFQSKAYKLTLRDGQATYSGDGFELLIPNADGDSQAQPTGRAQGEVDLTYFYIMNWLRRALLDDSGVNYVNA
jgi:putative selenate reductase